MVRPHSGAAQLNRGALGRPMRSPVWLLVAMALASHPAAGQHVDTLTDADLVLAGLKVGDSVLTARMILGAPIAVSARRLSYPGLTLFLDAHAHCDEFLVTSPKWATARGLRVGDSVTRVF